MESLLEKHSLRATTQWLKTLRTVVLVLYLLLAFLDKPYWCEDVSFHYHCTTDGFSPPMSGLPQLPVVIMRSLEIVFLLIMLAFALWKIRYSEGWKKWTWGVFTFALACAIGDCAQALASWSALYAADLLRPVALLVFSAKMRACSIQFLTTLQHTMKVLCLTIFHVAAFSWTGYVLFFNSAEGLQAFSTFGESLWSLFILLTTTNYPDVMLPAYASNRAYSIFFIVFLAVGLFFLYRLLLSVVYASYKVQIESRATEYFNSLSARNADDKDPPATRSNLRALVESPWWELSMSLISLMNLFSQVMESLLDPINVFYWVYVQVVFLALHWCDSIMHILALRPRLFAKSAMNVFDALLNVGILILIIYILLPNGYSSVQYLKLLTLLRLVKLLKMLQWVAEYSLIFRTFVRLLPVAWPLFAMMFVIFYWFAAVGIRVFGGSIYQENASVYSDVTIPPLYVYNNFNDMGSGFITLWELLVVNNWWVIAQQFTDATSNGTRVFFLFYYIVAVVLGINLLVTLVVDMFCTQMEEEKTRILEACSDSAQARQRSVDLVRRTMGVELMDLEYTRKEES